MQTEPPAEQDRLLKVIEAAELLGISDSQVQWLVKAGRLPRVMIGIAGWRISAADLQRFIRENSGYEPTVLRRRKSA